MDSIPSHEFHKIFDRISQTIDLKGMRTPAEIEEELVRARNTCKRLSERAETRNTQVLYNSKKVAFDNLIEHRFANRVIIEAIADPKGIVALTLRYGREEARRRLLAQGRARARAKLEYRYGRPRQTWTHRRRARPGHAGQPRTRRPRWWRKRIARSQP